jgi:hypothetical protein
VVPDQRAPHCLRLSAMPRYVCAALCLVLWTRPALAQIAAGEAGPRFSVHWERWQPEALIRSQLLGAPREARRSNARAKWPIAGALVGGALSAAVANALCERQSGCTGPTLKWGLIGGSLGAVVGALIRPKDRE